MSDSLSYNIDALGNRLAVGLQTLDLPGQVRILVPQPISSNQVYVSGVELRAVSL
jgi:hypothetical protein